MKDRTRLPLGVLTVTGCLLAGAVLAGCRAESGRTAMAQVPDGEGGAVSTVSTVAAEPETGAPSTALRRLWTGTGADFNFYASSPSPDGRYVTEIDWTTGDLAVRDLTTGELHRLTDKGSWDESDEFAEISIFSPGGRQVAFIWYIDELIELRVVDVEFDADGTPRGSEPRVVFSSAELTPYWLFGWSEKGEILATVYRPDKTNALALISVEHGTVEILKSFDWREPRAVLSPDGRFAAYDFPDDGSSVRDIHLMSLEDGREMQLVDDPAHDRVLAWLPGDGGLLFHSDRSGSPSVWRIPISSDGPSEPVLVREDVLRPQPLGMAGEAFYFGVLVDWPRRYTVGLDLERGRMLDSPRPVDDPYDRAVGDWQWSPDGRHVIYTASSRGPARRGLWMVLRSEEGEVIRDFGFDLKRFGSLRWAPDGESVYLAAVDEQARGALRRMTLATGEFQTIRPLEPREMGGAFALAPDGGEIYFRLRDPNHTDKGPGRFRGWIVARNLETGTEREVGPVGWRGGQAVSPDGTLLAYVDYDDYRSVPQLLVVPVGGGTPRELFRMEAGDIGTPWWTPDSRTLVFRASTSSDSRVIPGAHSVWTVPVDGGEPTRLEAFDELGPTSLRLHPDGHRLVFRTGEPKGELWALDRIPGASAATSADESSSSR